MRLLVTSLSSRRLLSALIGILLVASCEPRVTYEFSQENAYSSATEKLRIKNEADSLSIQYSATGQRWFWITLKVQIRNWGASSLTFDPWQFELESGESGGIQPQDVINTGGASFEPLDQGTMVIAPRNETEVSVSFQPSRSFEHIQAGQSVALDASRVFKREGNEISQARIFIFYPENRK